MVASAAFAYTFGDNSYDILQILPWTMVLHQSMLSTNMLHMMIATNQVIHSCPITIREISQVVW